MAQPRLALAIQRQRPITGLSDLRRSAIVLHPRAGEQPRLALILVTALLIGLAGCGLEVLTTFPLLLHPREATGPQVALSTRPTSVARVTSAAPLAQTMASDTNEAATSSIAQTPAVVQTKGTIITCQQEIEACGQAAAPYLSVPASVAPLLHTSPFIGTRGYWEEPHPYDVGITDQPLRSPDGEWTTFWICSGFEALHSSEPSNDHKRNNGLPSLIEAPPDCRLPG